MTAELVCAATDPAWLERRREGITATDIVTIAGLVTWDSPWALYHRKLGLLPEPEQSDRMRLGSWLEGHIADSWHAGLTSRKKPQPGGLYRSTVRSWQLATPDRVITNEAALAVLECKTWDERQGKHEWGPDGSDQMPAKVRAQVLWQIDTLGVATGHLAVVFLPSGEFRSYTIELDHDYYPNHSACVECAEIDGLRIAGLEFWQRLQDKNPPDLDGLEVTTDALRTLHPAPGGQEEVDYGLVESYDWHKMHESESKRMAQKALNEIRGQMGDAHEATVDGRVVFRRTIGKRAGYTVPPGETDVLRRIGKDKHDGD